MCRRVGYRQPQEPLPSTHDGRRGRDGAPHCSPVIVTVAERPDGDGEGLPHGVQGVLHDLGLVADSEPGQGRGRGEASGRSHTDGGHAASVGDEGTRQLRAAPGKHAPCRGRHCPPHCPAGSPATPPQLLTSRPGSDSPRLLPYFPFHLTF